MKLPKRATRLLQKSRIISKRKKIIKSKWNSRGNPDVNVLHREPGRLNKYNLKCGCNMCARPRYDRSKEKRKQND